MLRMGTMKKAHDPAQMQLFAFQKDDSCVGLPCQKIDVDPKERILTELDRRRDRKEGAKNFRSFANLETAPNVAPKRKQRNVKHLFKKNGPKPFPSKFIHWEEEDEEID